MESIEKYKELMDEAFRLLRIIVDNHAVMQNRLSTTTIEELEECKKSLIEYDVSKEMQRELTEGTYDKAEIKKRLEFAKFFLSEKTDRWAPTYETFYELDIESFSIDNEELMNKLITIKGEKWAREALLITEEIARLINLQTSKMDECLERMLFFVDEKLKERKQKEVCFDNCVQYSDKEKLKKRLHELIDGKGGADVGSVIFRAKYFDHLLSRYPTQAEFRQEFTLVGSWSAIHNYFDENDTKVYNRAENVIIF